MGLKIGCSTKTKPICFNKMTWRFLFVCFFFRS
nr:MAG TPA: hypothetical protein [Bacteriophage sp.]